MGVMMKTSSIWLKTGNFREQVVLTMMDLATQ
jgi:hypothetical protein